jgi:uncharacterized repeat protein (TIGR01451 family)
VLFGGHLAASTGPRGWGIGLGSSSVSGGPYHIKWDLADGASIGNRDNQIMSSAVLAPALAITKTADAASVTAGATIGFTVTVSNTGAGSANNVSMTDTLPTNAGLSWTIAGTTGTPTCAIAAGVLTCTKSSLAPATSFTVHITSPTTAASCGVVSNSAVVTAGADSAGPATASVTVNCPDVSVSKSARAASVDAGSPAIFDITVTAGGSGGSTAVTLTDDLSGTGLSWAVGGADASACSPNPVSAVLTCAFGTMASGSTKSISLTATTTASQCSTGLSNTATVSSTVDSNAANNTATASIAVTCQPNVAIAKSGSAAVSAGGAATFTIVVSAGGTGPSTNVVVSDTLPAGAWTLGGANAAECAIGSGTLTCTFGTMASGTSKTVTLSRATTAQDCPAITNTATVTAAGDSISTDNSAAASVVVNCASKLAITKNADAASVAAGGTIGFVITVTNNGNATAANVQVTDALPTGTGITWTIDAAGSDPGCVIASGTLTCTFGSVAPAASKHVHVTSPTSTSSCGATYTNTARATADQNEPVAATASTSLQACPPPPAQPQLSITKTADAPFVTASASMPAVVGFTITVTNVGPVSTTATLFDTPVVGPNPSTPAGNAGTAGLMWTIDEAGSDSGCTLPLATLTCSFGTLAPGQSRHVHITATVVGRATVAGRNDNCGQRVDNTATVQFGGQSLQSNRATEDVNCLPPTTSGRLTILKFSDLNANAVLDAGDAALAGWTFQVKNNTTGETRTVTTGANGQAVIEDLAFGDYTVTELSCTSPCDFTRWIPIGHRIGTLAPVKDGKASAVISISAADQSIAFANILPRLPSTSTLPNDRDDVVPFASLIVALMLAQLAIAVRVIVKGKN